MSGDGKLAPESANGTNLSSTSIEANSGDSALVNADLTSTDRAPNPSAWQVVL